VTWNDQIQLELIQPLTGRSIYDEHLESRGEGLHHVKVYYADCAKAVADYARRGYPVIQSGKLDDDEHYYLDTEKDFGYIIELGNAGKIRAPERRYPA
jgi:4-hydroxyphenylpyruvate dioxygenase-like putative hemolysin